MNLKARDVATPYPEKVQKVRCSFVAHLENPLLWDPKLNKLDNHVNDAHAHKWAGESRIEKEREGGWVGGQTSL